jgi:hypothetical protein
VLSLVQFMLFLDATVVNVALHPIERGPGMGPVGLAWVLLGGVLSDVASWRWIFPVYRTSERLSAGADPSVAAMSGFALSFVAARSRHASLLEDRPVSGRR